MADLILFGTKIFLRLQLAGKNGQSANFIIADGVAAEFRRDESLDTGGDGGIDEGWLLFVFGDG
jgi:hypothetical protein